MCVIIEIDSGKEFPYHNLKHAVSNNKDGFGIIAFDKGKIISKKFVEKEGNDPEHVAEVLKSYRDKNVILHLRNNTKGKTNEENAHPFLSHKDKKNNVLMMHNGTMFDYHNEFKEGNDDERSDTQLFNEHVLSPYLKSLRVVNGIIRLDTDINKFILSKMVTGSNKIVLVNNDQDPLYVGDWLEFTQGGETFKVSNNQYFYNGSARTSYHGNYSSHNQDLGEWARSTTNTTSKGKELTRESKLKESAKVIPIRKEPLLLEKNTKSKFKSGITTLSEITGYLKYEDAGMVLSGEIKTLLDTSDKYLSLSSIRSVAFMNTDELMEYMTDDGVNPINYCNLVDVAELSIALAMDLVTKVEEEEQANAKIKTLEEKLTKATNHIATLTNQLKREQSAA